MKAAAVLVAWLVFAAPQPIAHAQGDRDTREVSGYKFTEAGLAKYSQAIHDLSQAAKNLPGACDGDEDEDDSATSIASLVKKLEATPGAKKAIEGAGLTTHEYVVFTFAWLQSAGGVLALDQPGGELPPGVSKANVEFVRAHKAAFEKLGATTHGQCDEEGDRDSDDHDDER